MEIQTTEQMKIANFLNISQKCGDWRYETWRNIQGNQKTKETIYWIGSIDLKKIGKEITEYHIFFINKFLEFERDYKILRYEDGASVGKAERCLFDLQKIHHILIDKQKNYRWFNVLLKESVNKHGIHRVELLHDDEEAETKRYGIPTDERWVDEPLIRWLSYMTMEIPESLAATQILHHGAYNWLK